MLRMHVVRLFLQPQSLFARRRVAITKVTVSPSTLSYPTHAPRLHYACSQEKQCLCLEARKSRIVMEDANTSTNIAAIFMQSNSFPIEGSIEGESGTVL